MAKNKPSTDSSTRGVLSLGTKAIASNRAIAALAMKGATPREKRLVYGCSGIILLCIIVLGIPPYETRKQLAAFLAAVCSLAFILIKVGNRYSQGSGSTVSPVPEVPPVVGPPQLSEAVYGAVRDQLGEARAAVFDFLKKKNPALTDQQVRANIFLPHYGSTNPDDYTLLIYEGLHFNMELSGERGIILKPDQGATGKVFKVGRARSTLRNPSGPGEWDDEYKINEELAKIIHPDLQWIISMPLKNESKKSIGVLNIDGLHEIFNVDVLNDCGQEVLGNYAMAIGHHLTGK